MHWICGLSLRIINRTVLRIMIIDSRENRFCYRRKNNGF